MWAWLLTPLISFGKFLAPIFIQEFMTMIRDWYLNRKKLADEAKQNAKASETYKGVVNDPNASREDRKNAENDYLNS